MPTACYTQQHMYPIYTQQFMIMCLSLQPRLRRPDSYDPEAAMHDDDLARIEFKPLAASRVLRHAPLSALEAARKLDGFAGLVGDLLRVHPMARIGVAIYFLGLHLLLLVCQVSGMHSM